jgi:chromosome partitioning protein
MIQKKIFAFCNQKGGVGKTTSVSNIAAVLTDLGSKVLIIDMDAQANCTSGLGLEKPSIEFTTYQLLVENIDPMSVVRATEINGLSIVPSSADLSGVEIELINAERREYALKNQMQKIIDKFDYIFIDCPPSLGLITINALVAADCVIIPLQCEYYALEGLGQLLYTVQLVKSNLNPALDVGGVILTMADFRTNLTQQVIEEVKKYFNEKVFESIVPRSVKLSEAPSFGKPAVVYDPSNRGSKCYKEIGREFAERFAGNIVSQTSNELNNQNANSDVSRENDAQESVAQLGQ